jgi:hypothetical protein
MSEATVFSALASILSSGSVANIAPNLDKNVITRIFEDPPEGLPDCDMPFIILFKDPTAQHTVTIDSVTGGRHTYQVLIYLILGIAETPLPELHGRAKPWGSVIATLLNHNRDLNGACFAAWALGQDTITTYTSALLPWGSGVTYWGLRFSVTITELID